MKTKLVPETVNYLTDWDGFELPNGVFNKGITACGATTLAIRDEHKTIICSPRNNLIENKHAQHPNTLLVVGRIPEEKIKEYLSSDNLPKILVSYDSLPKVAKCIENKNEWRVVVDEFQYLLSDSSMKSEVEIRLLECLKQFSYVTYMSATPILSKYLDKISWLSGVEYVELIWPKIEKIKLIRQQSKHPINSALEIVRQYQNGVYPRMEINGEIKYSKECVIYLNSVNNIVNIIKQTGLKPDEVNIIVGNNEENDIQIAKIGEGFKRGRIPLNGEQHKKFTFCTSTAFAGCDFYSTNASSFVISDSKRINTTIDIATDLLQIAGRQRLAENPFRRHLTFIYNLNSAEMTGEEFSKQLEAKLRLTQSEIDSNNSVTDPELRKKRIRDLIKLQKMMGYDEAFTMYDEKNDKFIVNELAYLNEQYAYDLQRHNYLNGLIVKKQIDESHYDLKTPVKYVEYEEQLRNIIKKGSFAERMKVYCDNKGYKFDMVTQHLSQMYPQLQEYYDELGSNRIKALGYKESALKKEITYKRQTSRLTAEFRKIFKTGERYLTSTIKRLMAEVYTKVGVDNRPAVATDLEKKYGIKIKSVKIY